MDTSLNHEVLWYLLHARTIAPFSIIIDPNIVNVKLVIVIFEELKYEFKALSRFSNPHIKLLSSSEIIRSTSW
jgi:hypothetical protein